MSEKTIPERVGVEKIASRVRLCFAFIDNDSILCYHLLALFNIIIFMATDFATDIIFKKFDFCQVRTCSGLHIR